MNEPLHVMTTDELRDLCTAVGLQPIDVAIPGLGDIAYAVAVKRAASAPRPNSLEVK